MRSPSPSPKRVLPRWLLLALIPLVAWGLWGYLSLQVSLEASASLTHILSTAGALSVLPFLLLGRRSGGLRGGAAARGAAAALLSGVLGGAGNVCLYHALAGGGLASVVYPYTGLYPLVTIAIAILLLGERLSRVQAAGLLLAVPAILLLNSQNSTAGTPEAAEVLRSRWFWVSSLALCLWGVSAALQKVSTVFISARSSYAVFTLGYLVVALVLLAVGTGGAQGAGQTLPDVRAALTGILAGVFNAVGVLGLFAALASGGQASAAVPFSALYPVVTVALAVVLHGERPAVWQAAGAALAVIAGALLGWEREAPSPEAPPPASGP